MDKTTMIFEEKEIPVFFKEVITGQLATDLSELAAKLPGNDIPAQVLELQAAYPDIGLDEIITTGKMNDLIKQHGLPKLLKAAKAAQEGEIYIPPADVKIANKIFGQMYCKIVDIDKTVKTKNNLTTAKKKVLAEYLKNKDMWLGQNIEVLKKDVLNFCRRIELYI